MFNVPWFQINTVNMTIAIPESKLSDLKTQLNDIVGKKKVTLKQLQSLAGLLTFCCRAIPSARAFNRRFYAAMAGVKKSFHYIKVSKGMRDVANMWLQFLDKFNGTNCISPINWLSENVSHLFTDSSRKGCGAYCNGEWSFMVWPSHWSLDHLQDMTFLELIPIILAMHLWFEKFKNSRLLIHTDNQALVAILNTKASKSDRVMFLIRHFVLKTMTHNICLKSVFISTHKNEIADSISRFQWDRFRNVAPLAEAKPLPIPLAFWDIFNQL